MPLALILNELLTNAVKHGCDEHSRWQVWVSFKRLETDFELTVRDSGPGYVFEETGRRSSGTGLVAGLVRQLRGSFTVAPGAGAVSTVRFAAELEH
jgi:two-component sensor histidine kinase